MKDGIRSYVWNGEGQITKADTTNYSYDGDGQRVEKSGGMIYWYGAGGEVLDETDLQGNLKDEYVYFGGQARRRARCERQRLLLRRRPSGVVAGDGAGGADESVLRCRLSAVWAGSGLHEQLRLALQIHRQRTRL